MPARLVRKYWTSAAQPLPRVVDVRQGDELAERSQSSDARTAVDERVVRVAVVVPEADVRLADGAKQIEIDAGVVRGVVVIERPVARRIGPGRIGRRVGVAGHLERAVACRGRSSRRS